MQSDSSSEEELELMALAVVLASRRKTESIMFESVSEGRVCVVGCECGVSVVECVCGSLSGL